MIHTIDRFCSGKEMGTFGRWMTQVERDWIQQCYTVEQPWRVNEQSPAGIPFHSCIPAGKYELVPFVSDRWGTAWAFVNPELGVVAKKSDMVKDWYRYACLVHTANWAINVEGCVGPGDGLSAGIPSRGNANGVQWMVTNSGTTMKKLGLLLSKHDTHHVTIRDVGLTHTFSGR